MRFDLNSELANVCDASLRRTDNGIETEKLKIIPQSFTVVKAAKFKSANYFFIPFQ